MIFNIVEGLQPYRREINVLDKLAQRLKTGYQNNIDGLWDESFKFAPIFETVSEDVKIRGEQNLLKYLQQLQARVEYWMQHFESLDQPVQQLQMMTADLKFTLWHLQFEHNQTIKMLTLTLRHEITRPLTQLTLNKYDKLGQRMVVANYDFKNRYDRTRLGKIIGQSVSQLRTAFGSKMDALLKNQVKRQP